MRYLQTLLLLLLTGIQQQTNINAQPLSSFGQRLSDAKERTVRTVSAWLVLWSGTTKEDQLKRLDYYLRLAASAKNGKYLKRWKLYKKRWYVWIVDGKMPIKNPDGRISDAEFAEYVIKVQELMQERPLTQEEKDEVCLEIQKEIEQYRRDKGIK